MFASRLAPLVYATFIALVSTSWHELKAELVPFVAYQPAAEFSLQPIVLQYDPVAKTGANWAEVKNPQWHDSTRACSLGRCAEYVRDALQRMTGKDFPVISTNDLSRGIVLTLLKNAPADIRDDSEIQRALQPDPQNPIAANEAYCIRSETNRVLVVANTVDGLADGVVELMESVDYEILGMGVDWIYAPDHRNKPLVFKVNRGGRATFYRRSLWAHSGQSYGYGTIMSGLTGPMDEPVYVSSWRWTIGTRMFGKSMPDFPGHALQAYHRAIIEKMHDLAVPEGFFARIEVGPEARRPPAGPEAKELWWVNTDPKGTPEYDKVSHCDGKEWTTTQGLKYFGSNVDVSSPLARQVIFEGMKKASEAAFKAEPDDMAIFPMDPEDGGVDDTVRDQLIAHRNWYPEYLAQEKLPFGRPYVLHGYKGLNQPTELWDPKSASDNVAALACWLLREYDKWIEALPPEQQVTATGKVKKELIRCSFQSYNMHDVPPNFNPDRRIRVSIAPFPKHRGLGKWEKLATQEDMARAYQIMLPGEPSGDYSFFSFSYYHDGGPGGIPTPAWSGSAATIAATYRRAYEAGYRSIVREADFNFGKSGLGYYLVAKALWNVNLTAQELDAIRDRWFQRSFGSAWQEMKTYYDFMLVEHYPVNSPNTWAKAIRIIEAADKKLEGASEPDAQRRLDDVKQYWFSHYLMDTGLFQKDAPEVKEYVWKGQMSYMVGMQGLLGRDFARAPAKDVAGPEISAGPAHYTHAETQVWWPKLLDYWKITPVSLFSDATLANGHPAKEVDLNDLVAVKEFQSAIPDAPFLFNSAYMTPGTFLMVAEHKGETVGFSLTWPFNPLNRDYMAKKVAYGAEIWDTKGKTWEPWIDQTMTTQESVEKSKADGRKLQVVEVARAAPRPGTYRFTIGQGGNLSLLGSPAYDPQLNQYAGPIGFTYYNHASGLTQSPVYIYIPKGTKSLDLDVWDNSQNKFVTLFQGMPDRKPAVARKVSIGSMGVHTIALEPGEDGSLAMIHGDNFFFPFVYSVPTLWAKSPGALLVPRAIAEADALTIAK